MELIETVIVGLEPHKFNFKMLNEELVNEDFIVMLIMSWTWFTRPVLAAIDFLQLQHLLVISL